jgi:hypothetical protein
MTSKRKLAIAALTVIAFAAISIRDQLSYPAEWDNIDLGMSRETVEKLIGPGEDEFVGWKGPFWNNFKTLIKNELQLGFTKGKVSLIIQRQYLATGQPLRDVRAEANALNEGVE